MSSIASASDYEYDITAWLPSQDGDFCHAFLMKCLSRFEFQRFQGYQRTLEHEYHQQQHIEQQQRQQDEDQDGVEDSHHQKEEEEEEDEDTRRIDIQVESILSCLEAMERAKNLTAKKEKGESHAREEDEVRQVLIKIILGWVDGCKGVSKLFMHHSLFVQVLFLLIPIHFSLRANFKFFFHF